MIKVAYFPSSVEICLLLYVKRDRDRERERKRERERENMIVLVHLSEGTTGDRRGKKNVKE
jgi:hypothetical protein